MVSPRALEAAVAVVTTAKNPSYSEAAKHRCGYCGTHTSFASVSDLARPNEDYADRL